MSNIVPLDNVHHAQLRILAGHGAAFGDAVNLAPLFVTEFAEAQRHYPILFRPDDAGALQPLAILGFDRDENLFLGGNGWSGYVPAIFRRGPFLLTRGEGDDPVIVVDLDHPRVRDGGAEGAPLFLDHGGRAPALEAAIAALRQIHAGAAAASRLQETFLALELIEPVALRVEISDEKSVNFEGFSAVTEERLRALDGARLNELNSAGLLSAAVLAAASLGNMAHLIARKRRRDGEGA
jgi:SapC protein